MRSLIRRENKFFVSAFSVIGSLLALFSFLIFSDQYTQAYKQLSYLQSSNFEYAFTTDGKLPKNSYLDIQNTKLFFLEEDLTTRLQVSGLMQLDVAYDESTLINSHHILNSTNPFLNEFEVLITLNTAKTYNLKLENKVYSKSIVDQQVHEYTVKGITSDIYSTKSYNFTQSKGLLIIGFSAVLEENSNSEYVNYTSFDPSAYIIENEVNLINLYQRDELMSFPAQQTIGFILVQTIVTIFFSFISFMLLLKDFEGQTLRLKEIGASNILTRMILIRAITYLVVSSITILLFNTAYTVFCKKSIEISIILTVQFSIILVVLGASLVKRYRRQGEN